MSSRTEFLERIRRMRVSKLGGKRAPHRGPLLLLYALGRVADKQPRLTPYVQVDNDLRVLLARFGLGDRKIKTFLPFIHLCSSELWEVPEFGDALPRGSARSHKVLREAGARGGISRRPVPAP